MGSKKTEAFLNRSRERALDVLERGFRKEALSILVSNIVYMRFRRVFLEACLRDESLLRKIFLDLSLKVVEEHALNKLNRAFHYHGYYPDPDDDDDIIIVSGVQSFAEILFASRQIGFPIEMSDEVLRSIAEFVSDCTYLEDTERYIESVNPLHIPLNEVLAELGV